MRKSVSDIVFGIGIDMHPPASATTIANRPIRSPILSILFELECSPPDLYYFALYKGFCDVFARRLKDP